MGEEWGQVRTIRAEWKYTYMYLVTNDSLPVYRGVCVCVHVCARVCVCDVWISVCISFSVYLNSYVGECVRG